MQFELKPALIDDILFSMEDQGQQFLLDVREGTIVNPESDEIDEGDEDRYLSLPGWEPTDGFRLMEHFTAKLHNPVVRTELSAALDRGKGVFRAFKDTLALYPEVEKRWFVFKDREMKRKVIRWYNSLRESWGLELIGEEPEDIDDLAMEDFRFREGSAADGTAALELHRLCLEETLEEINKWVFPGDLCFVAEAANGEFAAYISSLYTTEDEAPDSLHICALEVNPEYRGLGLGEALLSRLLTRADSDNIPHISIDLPVSAENFSRVLARESFQTSVTRYCRTKQ